MARKCALAGLTAFAMLSLVTVGSGALGPESGWRAVSDREAARLIGGQTCELKKIKPCPGGAFGCVNLACWRNDALGKYMKYNPDGSLRYCGVSGCGSYFLSQDCMK
jgi:hypothetical protein